jgi:hypothetical protein
MQAHYRARFYLLDQFEARNDKLKWDYTPKVAQSHT